MDVKLLLPKEGETLSLFTDAQRTFRAEEERRKNLDAALTFHWYEIENTGRERSHPAPVRFSFEDAEGDSSHYIVLLSEYEDLSAPRFVFTNKKEAEIYNLKAGTRYYWCIQKDGVRSLVSYFDTAWDLPRCLFVEGVSNVRDIGGYETKEGRIRQGLLYRGSEFEIHTHPTEQGVANLRSLGIRTDLDLRAEAIERVLFPTSALFGMDRVLLPTVAYKSVFDKKHRKNTRRFFALLAQKKNYPIYVHCWGGADRTGTLFFLLGAFLGMCKEDLIYDYEFTSLSYWGTRTRNHPPFMEFLRTFEALNGNSYEEKATFFLHSILGLTEKQTDTIKDIFVPKG